MTAAKHVARGIVIWMALGAVVRADGINNSSWGSSGSWYFFFRGNASRIDPLPINSILIGNPNVVTPSPAPSASPVQNNTPTINYTPPAFPPMSIPVPPSPSLAPPASPSSFSTPHSGGQSYDAYINLTSSAFQESSQLTTGNAQAWYLSPTVEKLYGGVPSAAQQQQFTDTVLSRVEQTFNLAGLHPTITTDPTAQANHTLSVVSGASYGPNSNAIGITDVGGSGFGFIDKLSYGNDVNSLEWAVAHNVSHELMHAFGVGSHPDTTGKFIDAATADWNLLTDPNATFSSGAISAIQATNFGKLTAGNSLGAQGIATRVDGDQEIMAAPVPEPATILVWGLAGGVMLAYRLRRQA